MTLNDIVLMQVIAIALDSLIGYTTGRIENGRGVNNHVRNNRGSSFNKQ